METLLEDNVEMIDTDEYLNKLYSERDFIFNEFKSKCDTAIVKHQKEKSNFKILSEKIESYLKTANLKKRQQTMFEYMAYQDIKNEIEKSDIKLVYKVEILDFVEAFYKQ